MINITELPFNAHLGLEKCNAGEHLLKLPFTDHLTNHLGTLHASALFALAEASSGEFLVRNLGEQLKAVVRKTSGKYSAPAASNVITRSPTGVDVIRDGEKSVRERGRALVTVEIEILIEASGQPVGRFSFDWFLSR